MHLTREQVRSVDRIAIERYGIPGIVLMENAARAAAEAAREMLGGTGRVLILCGGGNNGGDGLAIARHLHNARVEVLIGLATRPSSYAGDALINWNITRAMNLRTMTATPELIRLRPWALIVDAVFGTGLAQAPRDPFPALADAVNQSDRPVLAIDVPSGLDCDTGEPLGACIRAKRTITFVAEKAGFAAPVAREYTGTVVVGDIGCPRELYEL